MDGRCLAALLCLNFVLVPIVVFVLSRFVAADQAVLLGVLLMLLAPCKFATAPPPVPGVELVTHGFDEPIAR